MADTLMIIFWARINALAFVGINYAFNKTSPGDAVAERKRHDLTEEKLRK